MKLSKFLDLRCNNYYDINLFCNETIIFSIHRGLRICNILIVIQLNNECKIIIIILLLEKSR